VFYMENNFSLLTDRWIPIKETSNSPTSLVSLQTFWDNKDRIYDVDGNPFLWTAIQRLLCGLYIKRKPIAEYNWSLYSPDCFLQQHFEAAADCGTTTERYLRFADENAVAWTPKGKECSDDVTAAQALVQAYFSDRQGIKNAVKSPIKAGGSGASIPQIGSTSLFRVGKTYGEFLRLNCDGLSDAVGDYLLHQWRQIQVRSPNQIIVAAGLRYAGEVKDPWVVDSGKLKHIRAGIEKAPDGFDGEYWQVSIVVMQASLLGCDRRVVELRSAEDT
jgi:hypothetical protein